MTVRPLRWIAPLAGAIVIVTAHAESAYAQNRATVPVFDLSVRLSTDTPALDVDGQVTIPGRNQPIDVITLAIDDRLRDFEIAVVSPAASADSASVSIEPRSAVVTLRTRAAAGSPVTLTFKYRIGAISRRSFYIAKDGFLISGEANRWYPRPSNYRRATGRIRFFLPPDVTIAATGRRIVDGSADRSVQFEITDPTTFSFAAGHHEVYRSPGEPAVALHLLKPRSRAGERLALIRRIVAALADEFGPYPHPDLEVVEMPAGAMGGSGNGTSLEGFVVVSTDVIERASLLTLAHEIGHQWWADSVFPTGLSSVLLTEAMVNYGALRAAETIHGERGAAEARWGGFPGDSLFAGGRGHLSVARAGMDDALTSPAVDGLVGGNKGMLVHDLLSRTMGRERFRTVLRTFASDHAFQDTTWKAFVTAVIAADPSLDWFFKQWYDRPGVPSWTVTWSQSGDQVRGVVTQAPPYFRAEVDVMVQGQDRRDVHLLRIDGARTEFAWPAGFPVASLIVDPDYKVPHDSPDRTADVDAIAALGPVLKAARTGGDFNEVAIAALRAEPSRSQPARDFLREAIQGGEAFDRGEWETARAHFDAALATGAAWPDLLPGVHYGQAVIARMRGDRPSAERSARAAIEADSRLLMPTGWSIAARELLDEDRR